MGASCDSQNSPLVPEPCVCDLTTVRMLTRILAGTDEIQHCDQDASALPDRQLSAESGIASCEHTSVSTSMLDFPSALPCLYRKDLRRTFLVSQAGRKACYSISWLRRTRLPRPTFKQNNATSMGTGSVRTDDAQ